MKKLPLLAGLLMLAAPVAFPQEAAPAGGALKVRKIVLYKHGVGYFEREGKVKDNQQVVLSFKSAQMKDLLKSLFAVDLAGGRVGSIMYDTKDPLSKQLEDVLIRVPDGNALTAFLSQLKGARVEVVVGTETAKGAIVGIEPVVRQLKEGIVTSYKLVVFREDGKLQPVDLLEMSSLKLLDEPLQKDLRRILDIHLKSKYADRKAVTINCTGAGERTIRAGYIVETPIWKTSYRLIFDEGGKPLLQGWAILENPTDEDWEDVEVTFVAGAPISFVMDLYTAYYPRRYEIPVGATAAARPEGYMQDGLAKKAPPAAEKELRRRLEDAATGPYRDEARKKDKAGGEAKEDVESFDANALERSLEPMAAGVQVGEMFAYRAKEKVTVRRGQAALVPILSERLDSAERILYFKQSFSPRPANAVKFKNTTALTLEAGPVTFFDGATCIGEGLLRKITKPAMTEVIPFAFESAVSVTLKSEYKAEPVRSARLANGVLWTSQTQNLVTTYEVKNQGTKDYALWLDHPAAQGYALAEPAKAEDEADGHRRFKVESKGGMTVTLTVRESAPVSQSVSILGTPAETIRFYVQQPYLSARTKAFLESVLGQMTEVSQLQGELGRLGQERHQLEQDQARARQNLQVLRDRPDELQMRQKYLKRLEDADGRIDEIARSVREKTERKTALEQDLAKKIREYQE